MKRYWYIINLIITLLSLSGIYLVSTGRTSLQRVDEMGQDYRLENLTLPPAFTFSIWGLIYLGFLVFSLLQISPGLRNESRFSAARWLITFSVGLNLGWIVLVGLGEFFLPYVLQWLMMVLAVVIVARVARSEKEFHSDFDRLSFVPFKLNAGWLIVAMIPFTTDVFLSLDWRGRFLPAEAWAIMLYLAGSLIVYAVFDRFKSISLTIPWLWALLGFAIKFNGVVSYCASALLIMMSVAIFYKKYFETRSWFSEMN